MAASMHARQAIPVARQFTPPGAPEGHRDCCEVGGVFCCECTKVFASECALSMHHAFATSDAIVAKAKAERDEMNAQALREAHAAIDADEGAS